MMTTRDSCAVWCPARAFVDVPCARRRRDRSRSTFARARRRRAFIRSCVRSSRATRYGESGRRKEARAARAFDREFVARWRRAIDSIRSARARDANDRGGDGRSREEKRKKKKARGASVWTGVDARGMGTRRARGAIAATRRGGGGAEDDSNGERETTTTVGRMVSVIGGGGD